MNETVNKIIKGIEQNSTTILTGMAVTGVITTTVLGVRATAKSVRKLDGLDEETRAKMTKTDVIKHVGKHYIPTVISGLGTIGCVIGSHRISSGKIVALTSAYASLDRAAKDYEAKVTEKVGEEKAKEIKKEFIDDRVSGNTSNREVILMPNEQLFYDVLSGRYFRSNEHEVVRIVAQLNQELACGSTVSLNDLYHELEIDTIGVGDDLTWHLDDGIIDVEIGTTVASNGQPCLTLEFGCLPQMHKGW